MKVIEAFSWMNFVMCKLNTHFNILILLMIPLSRDIPVGSDHPHRTSKGLRSVPSLVRTSMGTALVWPISWRYRRRTQQPRSLRIRLPCGRTDGLPRRDANAAVYDPTPNGQRRLRCSAAARPFDRYSALCSWSPSRDPSTGHGDLGVN